MKVALLVLLAVLSSFPGPLSAAENAVAGDVVVGFTGGAVWTSASTGICLWYLPVVGDEPTSSIFDAGLAGPVYDREHAHFLWVSDFNVVPLRAPAGFALVLVPAGTATVYYTTDPTTRDFTDLNKRTTWGTPVAKFVRKASLLRSPDNFASDTFTFSADLVSSEAFRLANGKIMDFKSLIPKGMTCFENGQTSSSWEAGVCVAKGN